METTAHQPVLLREALEVLAVRPGGFWVDGTVGAGGPAEALLRAPAPDGRLLPCGRDAEALAAAPRRHARFGAPSSARGRGPRSRPRGGWLRSWSRRCRRAVPPASTRRPGRSRPCASR